LLLVLFSVLTERSLAAQKRAAMIEHDGISNNLHVSTVCANNVSYGIDAGSALQMSAGAKPKLIQTMQRSSSHQGQAAL
jgi:hypothetical protein